MARTGASSGDKEVRKEKEVKSENNSGSWRREQRKLTWQNHHQQDGQVRVKGRR